MSFDDKDWPPPHLVRRSGRARRVSLRVSDAAGLEVILPQKARLPDVPALLARHRAWIARRLSLRAARLSAREALHGASPFAPPAGFWLHGGELRVDLDIRPGAKAAALHAALAATPASGTAIWPLAEVAQSEGTLAEPLLLRRLCAHVKSYARLFLAARLAAVSARCGLSAGRLAFGTQKSRWGSYAPDGCLRLNHKLVFLPALLADSVILHELCHSLHPHHGPAFWGLMQKLDPEIRKKNKDLQNSAFWIPLWFN